MEEPISILSLNRETDGEPHVQQPLYINNAQTRLIEAEHKLNRVFEEYTGRIESFMLVLDTLKDGVLIINKVGETCYCNEAAHVFLKDPGNFLSGHLTYRSLLAEEFISVNVGSQHNLRLRINNFFWNDEPCNIFIIEQTEVILLENPLPTPVVDNKDSGTLMAHLQHIAALDAAGKTTEAAQYAETANKTVAESEKLLSDAKVFIALINYKPAFVQISMQKIAGDVLKSMGPEIEEAEIEVTVSELPETTGDKELITKLLKHLISNALKFRNKGRKAIIDIGHDKSDGQYIFCVRDNGIGISKKHHEEIFNLFAGLNNQHEYPGNGMGLAICKKIVELHDGKIWVESLPGHGSNFYFKLNAK